MDSKLRRAAAWGISAFCLFFILIIPCFADGHRGSGNGFRAAHGQNDGRHEGAGGATGQIAAWLFGIANFPVALSILLKVSGKMALRNPDLRETLGRINRRQKRRLMKLHYWLNPIAVAVAVIHFLSTECEATAVPEIGLGVMLLVSVLGMMVTFRWSPQFMRKAVFRFHTSPVSLLAAVTILLVGHSMVD